MFLCQQQRQRVLDGQNAIKALLDQYKIAGFGRIVYTDDYSNGLLCLMQISGLGAFQPNCVLAQWPKKWRDSSEDRAHLIRMVQVAVVFSKVVLLAKFHHWP